jgi:signal peptidase I
VLNEGIIKHQGKDCRDCVYNESLHNATYSIALRYGKDSLFQFYSALIDLCARSKAGKFDLMEYFDPSYYVDDLIVKNHNKFFKQPKNGSIDNNVYKYTNAFIHEIYKWCKENGKITNEEYYKQCLGGVPQGLDKSNLEYQVYLYNPQKLPPNDNKIIYINGQPQKADTGTLSYANYILINDEVYYIPENYITDEVFEIEPRLTKKDLC